MKKKTHGRQFLTLNRIDDVNLCFIINGYEAKENIIMFTDFIDNNKVHMYPWHQIKHITIQDTDYDTIIDI
ncbi:hypothetical protein KAT92_06375 [Candidatus Babeliales bacterium]|nr:hypothetical protein [Candidatus Babeliales bacterium]